jgi:hypothetical protein
MGGHLEGWQQVRPSKRPSFARHHSHAGGVDDLRVGRRDVRTHRRNRLALDQHARSLKVADRAIKREHAAALDEDRTAGRDVGLLGAATEDTAAAAAVEAAAIMPAVPVQRNWRRDIADDGSQDTKSCRRNWRCANPSWKPPGRFFSTLPMS